MLNIYFFKLDLHGHKMHTHGMDEWKHSRCIYKSSDILWFLLAGEDWPVYDTFASDLNYIII